MTGLAGRLRRRWLAGRHVRPSSPAARRAAVAACLLAAMLASATSAIASASGDRAVALRISLAGLAFLAGALGRWPSLLTPALVLLGAAALVPTADASGTVGEVVVLAGLLVVVGELAGWAEDLRSIAPSDRGELAARAAAVGAWGVGAMVAAAGVLAVSGLGAPSEALAVVLGGSATLVVLAFPALRRWHDRP